MLKGTTTFRRTNAYKHSIASCIDLTFASTALKSRILSWGINDKSRWDMSDHRPTRSVLDFQPFVDRTVRYNYFKNPPGAFKSMATARMEEMSTYVLLSHGKLGQAALNLIQSIEDHRDKCIPSRFANPPGKIRFSLDPNIRLEMQNEAITVE
ncbi:uncharacterized protein FTOL_03621 [Fusarium torulosum]|uniref:Endonuclease/exonuclease/phosphatase domain-containing protein n=1 Tax=Fusarium torulosum TaxID=33205 RepID=A0AAE8SFR8_9HYPO|nr:uncharacterized protein FTOL_03621 [Fusarium torulosum]